VRNGTPLYREVGGRAPTADPARAVPWEASATGAGTQTLRWDVSDGHWSAVLMNADGSAGVSAVVSAGATLPVLGWGAITLLVTSGLLALVGLLLVLVALPRSGSPAPPSTGTPTPGSPALTHAAP